MAVLASWWVWVAAGVALGCLEVILPGYIFLGFALGAMGTGALIALGVLGAGVAVRLLVFAALSLAAWLVMRRVFGLRRGQVKLWDRDINDN